jgi:hypothetical protein
MRNGILYRLEALVPHTAATGFGSSPTHSVPTPTASDYIERRPTRQDRAAAFNPDTNKSVSLDRFVRLWPTPTVQDAHGRDRHNQKNGGVILSLLGQARQWPTPTARLGDPQRGMPSPATAEARYASGRRNLDDAVMLPAAETGRTAFATPESSKWRSPNTVDAKDGTRRNISSGQVQLCHQVGGSLNPGFVEWMMQYPKDWTVVD